MNGNTPPGEVSLRERLKSPPADELVASYYTYSVAAGIKHCFADEMRIHIAHALMLIEQGIISRQAGSEILVVLTDLQADGPAALEIDYRQEDLYSYIERHIIARLGADIGGRLHTGRSRNDLHTTSWRMALRGQLLGALGVLSALRQVLIDLAETHVETVTDTVRKTEVEIEDDRGVIDPDRDQTRR